MEDYKAAAAYYRTLADYEQTVLPVLIKLQNVNWELVRELILKHWRQQAASNRHAFFDRQNGPEYLAARFDKRRGAYPSSRIYLLHEFHPVRGWCELALDRTRRVPVGTFSPSQSPEQMLTEAETHYRYNNPFARRFAEFGYLSGQPVRAWGRAEVEDAWLRRAPDARAFMAEQVKKAAQFLQHDEGLQILLEPEAPRLRHLHGEKKLLGYVWYFFDCWAKFQEYEQALPPAAALEQSSPAALPTDADEQITYFDKVLTACKRAKHPHHIARILRAAFEEQKQQGLYALEEFWKQLPSYVLDELPDNLRPAFEGPLLRSLSRQFHTFKSHPETWPVWHVAQRGRLQERQQQVAESLTVAKSGGQAAHQARAVASWRNRHGDEAAAAVAVAQQKQLLSDVVAYRAILTHLGNILEALEVAKAAGREEVWASEIDGPADTVATPAAPSIEPDEPKQLPVAAHPWAEIEAIAEKIELRKNGRFLVPGNRIAAAGAGFIDALLDGGILPATLTRPTLYAAFSQHYNQRITAERTKPTRTEWHLKARRGLGLPDLKPPKRQM